MRFPRIVLGTLVAVGLFALAGSRADAQHFRPAPVIVTGGYYAPPVYAPVYRPVYVSPYAGYGVPAYGYSLGYYSAPGVSFGYSNGGYYGRGYPGRTYYGRPGFSFGVTFR